MSNYIKLDGTNIIGHCSTDHPGVNPGDYDATVNECVLVDSTGRYKYKYVGGQLSELNGTEINSHPLSRNGKLYKLRDIRSVKLSDADSESNKHADGDLNAIGTYAQQKTYRKALRDITSDYKDQNGDGTPALDSFALDMTDFDQWPTKPV